MLLTGSDLIATMSEPGIWAVRDLDRVLGRYSALIVERAGADMDGAIDALVRSCHNIYLIHQLVQNDVSATKDCLLLHRGLSVLYVLQELVMGYIEERGLYMDEGAGSGWSAAVGAGQAERAKEKGVSSSSCGLGGC